MKETHSPSRFLQRIGLALAALAAGSVAQAQLIPIWTVNYGQAAPAATARGNYYNTVNLSGLVFFQDTPTIDFNWGFGYHNPR